MTPIYAERREVLIEALTGSLAHWLRPVPAVAGLHLAAHLTPAANKGALFDALHRFTPGAQSVAEYSMQAHAPPMVVFGYGVIDAPYIRRALARLARTLA